MTSSAKTWRWLSRRRFEQAGNDLKAWLATRDIEEERCRGLCGKEDLLPSYRTVTKGKKSYEYAEWACTNPKWRARLSLGTSNDEAAWLFPIRKLTAEGKPHRETGSYGPHLGWTRFRGEAKEEAG
jgi:hypothetical protein